MTTINITIKPEDFLHGRYSNSYSCAITTALKREGYDLRHTGFNLFLNSNNYTFSASNFKDLHRYVQNVYCNIINPIKEFHSQIIFQ